MRFELIIDSRPSEEVVIALLRDKRLIELHKENNFELIMFTDDNFLARSFSEMDEFYERWNKEINIPYWINTCIETLNEQNLPKLKKSQCIGISIGMETGSEWIEEICY